MAGAYLVSVADQPVLYVERGGRGLITLVEAAEPGGPSGGGAGRVDLVQEALVALAEAVRGGRVGKLSLERIDGQPAISSTFVGALVDLGFQSGPRRLTLSA